MAWLDKVSAIPALGVLHGPTFVPLSSMPQHLARLMDDWATQNRVAAITSMAPFAAQFEIEETQITLRSENLLFQYAPKVSVTGRLGKLSLKDTLAESTITYAE